jgi:uncharacterized DUF497 family protein
LWLRLEWDETKRLENIHKHGIDFVDIRAVFDGLIVTIEDDRFEYDEIRFVTFGLLSGRVVAVVHTERGDVTRIVSARKATSNEQFHYFDQIAHGLGTS